MKRVFNGKFRTMVSCGAAISMMMVMNPATGLAGLREPMAKESELAFAQGTMARGAYPAAAGLYRELITEYPRDPRVWAGLGRALSVQGDREYAGAASARAAELYRERVQLRPSVATNYVELARVLGMAGREEEAQAALDEGLQQNPQSEILLAEQRLRAARAARLAARAAAAVTSKTYFVDEALEGELAGKNREEVKAVLQARGIPCLPGASVIHLPKRSRVVIRQSGEGHAAVEKLLGKPARN